MAGIDHVVIGAATLAEGADYVEACLGIRPDGGGAHPGAGTHNLLLGLGEGRYLEVIAPDPSQPDPALPRLFGLDDPARRAALARRPALIAWVARTGGLAALADRLGTGPIGGLRPMSRGALSWTLASPPPAAGFDGLLPTLIEWGPPGTPPAFPDRGCRLLRLEGEHPQAEALSAALAARGLGDALQPRQAARARLILRLATGHGSGERVMESSPD